LFSSSPLTPVLVMFITGGLFGSCLC